MIALAWTLVAVLAVVAAALGLRSRRPVPTRRVAPSPGTEAPRAPDAGPDFLDHLPALAIVVDGDGRVLRASGRARERFGTLRQGMTLLEAFSQHQLVGPVREALDDLAPREVRVRLFAEGPRSFDVSVAPYQRDDGRREAVLLLDDQTDRSSFQELRSQFVANVSHELRTPLTGLSALLETMSDPGLAPDVRARFVHRARRETARLGALITDTLLLSELEATHGAALDDRVDLALTVGQAVDEARARAGEAGLALAASSSPGCVVALTERLAHTLVRNLVENAVRYAGSGSHVDVRVARSGPWVELTVADDGVGIAQEHLQHVFERFYRVDPSRSKELGGTGLGLSIVKHIAERCGGRAEAESRPGRGTTVRVRLPAR